MASAELFVGLMSGTSLDGVDAVLLECGGNRFRQCGQSFLPYDEGLRAAILEIHEPRSNELHEAQLLANRLSRLYAAAVSQLLSGCGIAPQRIRAVGCHGQTIRHRPELGYTIQLVNGALLAELAGIAVVCDFRSRDIAAGGEGAPLVPAFHRAAFGSASEHRVIVNIGGIANLTDLPAGAGVSGFDTGPGNLLMDAWTRKIRGEPYDAGGAWASTGRVDETILRRMLSHPFFGRQPPKSTGRDTFHLAWLEGQLSGTERPQDVQATLLALTVDSIAHAIELHCPGARQVFLCGGGARNDSLTARLKSVLAGRTVTPTDALGIGVDWVEACAFAWLAHRNVTAQAGNLPSVTGARGERILGAVYPA